jgi:glycosyltransferase involved in cell wall biosynthesis
MGLTKIMPKPLISVVIPNFNDTRIEKAICSVLEQKDKTFELIIVDGLSNNPEVIDIYKKFADHLDLLICEADTGIFDALNKGIKVANGKYIYLMGADDYLSDSDVFQSILELDQHSRKYDVFCMGCHFVDSEHRTVRRWIPNKVNSTRMRWGILPPHFSMFIGKCIYDEVGLFDLSRGQVGTDSCWLLKLAQYDKISYKVVSKHYLNMAIGGTSTGSLRNIVTAFINVAKVARELNYWNWVLVPIIKIIVKIPQFSLIKK